VNCPECNAPLPPDWCGHGDQALDREAFIGRQQAKIASLNAEIAVWRDADVGALRIENERLRRIEEAARTLAGDFSPQDFLDAAASLDALRAALEEAKR
jgi:hypothetical protein